MKKLFFLFAVSAMFAACSSDDQTEIVNGGGQGTVDPTETYVSANTVEFTNGSEISVGGLDENGDELTRAGGNVNFTIDLTKYEEVKGGNSILQDNGEYVLKADDFAIRVDGDYVEGIEPVDNKVEYEAIKIVENNLKVSVKKLNKLDFSEAKDYTFEVYLWIENKKLLDDGTGGYGELFDDSDKIDWVGTDFFTNHEAGEDISETIWEAYGEDGSKFFNTTEGGYLVRYNVYRGISGKPSGEYGLGDTPYIKVSIHVEKQDQTTVGEKPNQATYVDLPYTPKAE